MTNVTADGKYVCTVLYEDLSERLNIDLLHGYVGFNEYWAAKPLSRIIRVDVVTGETVIAFEEQYWIGHINTSPTQPHLLTYCHEGPWSLVDNRIWGLDLSTGQNWPIRPTGVGEGVGHEYWFTDGLHVGYHGHNKASGPFYGGIRYDNTEATEAPFPKDSNHFHSNDLNLIVGDGHQHIPYIHFWRFKDGQFEGPRKAFHHRGSCQCQMLHVHPRFSRDGKQVVFTTDMSGYGNVYLMQTPDFDTLPA